MRDKIRLSRLRAIAHMRLRLAGGAQRYGSDTFNTEAHYSGSVALHG
ncbi:hypothetical protein [Streptomyces canus]